MQKQKMSSKKKQDTIVKKSATSESNESKTSLDDRTQSSNSSTVASSESSSSHKPAGTGTLKSISNFLRSHKRYKSLDPSTLETSRSTESDDPFSSVGEDGARSQTPTKRYAKSPLKRPVVIAENIDENEEIEERSIKEINTEKPKSGEALIHEVLGISIEDWPYSEQALVSTISLKLEQEKTKRETLRLSSVRAVFDLVKFALDSGIPPNLVPFVFISGEPDQLNDKYSKDLKSSIGSIRSDYAAQQQEIQQQQHTSQQQYSSTKPQASTSVFKVNIPQQTQFQFHHWQRPGEPRQEAVSTPGGTGGLVGEVEGIDDRKRKHSDDGTSHDSIAASGPTSTSVKPSTPRRPSSSSHRRNQSEANVSQLRSLYENQILQQNQPNQQQQPQQQWRPRTLGSPYYPNRSEGRPIYYQYPSRVPDPAQHQHQNRQHQPYAMQYVQSPTPFTFPQPPQHQPQHQPPQPMNNENYLPPPSQIVTNRLPPPPPPPSGFTRPGSQGSNSLPHPFSDPQQLGSPGLHKKSGKSDVSFLISTPNNPPR